MTLDGSVHEATADANKSYKGEETTQVFGQCVVCELLYFLNCSAPDNIKDIAGTFYTDDQILAAKCVLWCENNKPHIAKYADRRNQKQRQKCVSIGSVPMIPTGLQKESFVLRVTSQQARQVTISSSWPASIKVRGYTSTD